MKSKWTKRKVRKTHLNRQAVVCVRTGVTPPLHVAAQKNGIETQLTMVEKARSYGWKDNNIVILDQDIGMTCSTEEGREGYRQMMDRVASGQVGAVLFFDASRVTRSIADWRKFCAACEAADTLLIDEHGLYDLCNPDDKLLLVIRSLIAEVDSILI